MVSVGQKAPDFTLKTIGQSGPTDFTLSSLKGKNVVLLFFPLVNTPVCHAELCGVRDTLADYQKLNAEVVALSVDSPFAQKLWADANHYKFTLVSDFNKEVSKAYGAQHEDLIGLKGVAKRSAFVIDKEGVLRFVWISDNPKMQPDFAAIQACLKGLS
jgi:peroxiredoxin